MKQGHLIFYDIVVGRGFILRSHPCMTKHNTNKKLTQGNCV